MKPLKDRAKLYRVKGAVSLLGSVVVWLIDKAIGDAAFATLRNAAGLPEQAVLWRIALEWGPAAVLAGAGACFFFRASQTEKQQAGEGGRGGHAKVGGGGIALGGPGGGAGAFGFGGEGGSAEVDGDGYAAGGAGGRAGQIGVWPPPASSGYEVSQRAHGLPIDPFLRQFGRGGVSPEYYDKLATIVEIKNSLLNGPCDPEETSEVSVSAINAALERKGLSWRVRIIADQYEFFLPEV